MAWITVHGRTTRQRGEPANWDAIKLVFVVKLNKYSSMYNGFLIEGTDHYLWRGREGKNMLERSKFR